MVLRCDNIEHGMRGGEGDRAAAIGGAEPAGAGSIQDLGAAGDRGQREAAGKAFGHGGDVGRHLMVIHGKHLAGAGKAGLHFVGDQKHAVLIAELAQRGQELTRRVVEATLALDRLDDDGGNAGRVDIGLEQAVECGQRIGDRHPCSGTGNGAW